MDLGSVGEFKWSSQHLEIKVVSNGYRKASTRGPNDAWSDEITDQPTAGRDIQVKFWKAIAPWVQGVGRTPFLGPRDLRDF
jgi:hypothetical protein